MNEPSNALRLRRGITDPVVLMISRQSVEDCDVDRVMKHSVRLLMAAREDVILYRQQVSIVFEGWDEDPRELVDVPEVRSFVKAMTKRWPEWAYFSTKPTPTLGSGCHALWESHSPAMELLRSMWNYSSVCFTRRLKE